MEKKETKFEVTTTVPGFMEAATIISALRAEFHGVTYDVSTATGMAKAVEARRKLREARVALDKKKPEVKREALDFCAKVEADYKSLRAAVSEYEDVADAAIQVETERKATEKAEKDRIAAEAQKVLDDKIIAIGKLPLTCIGKSIPEVEDLLTRLEPHPIGAEFVAENRNRAEAAKTEALESIREMLAGMIRAEELAEKIKADALIEAQKLEAERLEREERERILSEELAAKQAELDEQKRLQDIENEKLAKERAEFEAQQAEARKAQEAIDREAKEAQEKEEAERKRIQDEADAKKREDDHKAALDADRKAKEAEKNRKAAERALKLERARCQSASDAFRNILDICNDREKYSPNEALEAIELIASANI